jgi:hypothetical protein
LAPAASVGSASRMGSASRVGLERPVVIGEGAYAG